MDFTLHQKTLNLKYSSLSNIRANVGNLQVKLKFDSKFVKQVSRLFKLHLTFSDDDSISFLGD